MQASIKDKIEQWFSRLSHVLFRNPRKTLLIVFAFVALLCSQIPNIIIDVSPEALLHPDDPARLVYNEFRDQYGRPELIIVAVESPEIFSEAFLNRLKSLHTDLEEGVPYLRKVTSLINARDTYGEQDTLVVGELLEDWPEKPVDMLALKKRVLANPFYINGLISEDGLVTTLIIETEAVIEADFSEEDELDQLSEDTFEDDDDSSTEQDEKVYFSEEQNAEVVQAVNRIVARYDSENFSIAMAGDPIVIDTYNRTMNRDILIIIGLSMLTVAVFSRHSLQAGIRCISAGGRDCIGAFFNCRLFCRLSRALENYDHRIAGLFAGGQCGRCGSCDGHILSSI